VTSKSAAQRYARALFDVAVSERQDLDRIESGLAEFVQLFTDHPAFETVMLNPAVPAPRKRAAVEEITRTLNFVPPLAKLLALLADRDRLIVLPDLLATYRERLLDYRQWIRAEITTAVPLTTEHTQQIEQRLSEVTGKRVTVAARVDPAILGGVITRIGSTVYDSSVTRQLEKMKARLIAGA
jgi:F-type H+-transporting ATPase subunit delta